ncbi:MAG TPA: hypothetical protein VKS79_14460 [Gemmataceae bacterium]|nr:hypothetical protein [Gemmataceae bacterium]
MVWLSAKTPPVDDFDELRMGLSIYYNWKTRTDLAGARRLIVSFRNLALKLPFDQVSAIYEQDPPDGKFAFRRYKHTFRVGDLYLGRTRADGADEAVHVPALHAVFFTVHVRGSETAAIGLACHPPVVLHQEDVIERNEDGSERERLIRQGDPVEFPTRRRGYYSWHQSCKTQYAGNPKLGGEANFLKAHLSLIELLDGIQLAGVTVRVRDDSNYAKHRNVDRLLRSLRNWDALIANFAGKLTDKLGSEFGTVIAPIKDRPDFEHLEAKGIEVIRKMAARQRRRKKGAE